MYACSFVGMRLIERNRTNCDRKLIKVGPFGEKNSDDVTRDCFCDSWFIWNLTIGLEIFWKQTSSTSSTSYVSFCWLLFYDWFHSRLIFLLPHSSWWRRRPTSNIHIIIVGRRPMTSALALAAIMTIHQTEYSVERWWRTQPELWPCCHCYWWQSWCKQLVAIRWAFSPWRHWRLQKRSCWPSSI